MSNAHPTLGNGKICYIKMPAVDIQQSANFYKTVFGWHVRTRPNGHVAFDDGVGQVSGAWVTCRKPDPDPGLFIYVMVDDAEATLKFIVANGGKVVQPIGMDAPEITASFSDPAGNVLGIYQEPRHESK